MLLFLTLLHGPGKFSLDHSIWRRLVSSQALDGR
jgi:hypothetical protein